MAGKEAVLAHRRAANPRMQEGRDKFRQPKNVGGKRGESRGVEGCADRKVFLWTSPVLGDGWPPSGCPGDGSLLALPANRPIPRPF